MNQSELRFLQYDVFKFSYEYLKEKNSATPEYEEIVEFANKIYEDYLNIKPI